MIGGASGFMIGWHATRNISTILIDGKVKPARLPCVYAFLEEVSARVFASEFGYEAVVGIEFRANDIADSWSPKYARGGTVVRLKPGRIALVAAQHSVQRTGYDYSATKDTDKIRPTCLKWIG